jgi:hypothetical protein
MRATRPPGFTRANEAPALSQLTFESPPRHDGGPHSARHVGRAVLALWLSLALVVVSMPTSAWARGRKRKTTSKDTKTLLLLKTESNEVDDKTRKALSAALARQAKRYQNIDVKVSTAEVVEEMFAFECTAADVPCLARIAGRYKADLVIYSEAVADAETGKLVWALRVVDTEEKRVSQTTRQPLRDLSAFDDAALRALVVLVGPLDQRGGGDEPIGKLKVQVVGGKETLVYVDGQLVGRTGIDGLRVEVLAGERSVKLVRAGYKDWSTRVKVPADNTAEVAATLERDFSVKVGKDGLKVRRDDDESIAKKWWFWVLIGGAAAAATGTVLYLTRRGGDDNAVGTARFSIDSGAAHLDPVFGGGS